MKRKTIIAAITVAGLLLSLVGMQFVEVAKANPIHFPTPMVTFYSPLNQTQTTYYTSSSVPLNITVKLFAYNYEPGVEIVDWLNYSIDGQTAIPITVTYINSLPPNDYPHVAGWYGMLPRLEKGLHTLVVQGRTYFTNYNFHENILGTTNFYVDANDSCGPAITNLSVQNKTYSSSFLPLTFSLNQTTRWLGFSLDNQANVTLDGNVTLVDLTEGYHSLVVYANDTFGDMGKSDTVFFNIILPTPSPSPSPPPTQQPTLKPSPTPTANFYSDWIPYAIIAIVIVGIGASAVYLKKKEERAMSKKTFMAAIIILSVSLMLLSPFLSIETVRADETWTDGYSTTVKLESVTSPFSRGYYLGTMPLSFTLAYNCSGPIQLYWIEANYKIDNGTSTPIPFSGKGAGYFGYYEDNATVNTVLQISNLTIGVHTIYVYVDAKINWDNDGFIYPSHTFPLTFNVGTYPTSSPRPNATPPSISNVSVEQLSRTDFQLNFTVDKPTSWMGYSLDTEANVTLTGNTTIDAGQTGYHTITIYANDTAGNMGASDLVQFKLQLENFPTPTPCKSYPKRFTCYFAFCSGVPLLDRPALNRGSYTPNSPFHEKQDNPTNPKTDQSTLQQRLFPYLHHRVG